MKQKIIYFLKNALLINIVIFTILAPFSKKAVKISLLIALVLWIVITIAEFGSNFYRHLIVKTPINKQLMFFAFALLLSTIFSLDPYYSHAVLLERYLGYILFFSLGSYLVKSKRNLSVLIGAVILAGIVMGAGGMWDYFHLKPVRLYTAFGKTISNARFMVLQIPLYFIILLCSKNKFLKSGAIIATIVLFPCLILNASRAAWVAILAPLLIVSSLKSRKLTFCLLSFLIIIGLFLPLYLKQRAITTFDPLTWGERLPLWRMSLDMFADFPVFGAGLGMQEHLFNRYWKSPFPLHFQFYDAHNNYLGILSETGIIGLITFVCIFISFFKHVFVILNEISGSRQVILMGLNYSVIAALIFACSASNITGGVKEMAVFWFIFGMASGLIALKENQENIA